MQPGAPLLGFIGRLDYQKGVDIIRDSYDWLMAEGCQLVLLGSGREDLENSLRCGRLCCLQQFTHCRNVERCQGRASPLPRSRQLCLGWVEGPVSDPEAHPGGLATAWLPA